MEAVGLGVGVLGLAGLFSACIDCFELVQRGRYHGKDYLLLETKFTNQRLRLTTWGRACGFRDTGTNSNIFEDADLRQSIEATLVQLADLFTDGQVLRSKYGLKRDLPPQDYLASGRTAVGDLLSDTFPVKTRFGQKLLEFGHSVCKTQRDTKFSSKVRWAIEHKAKFTALIQDLKDFIDDLEDLTKWLNVSEYQRDIIQYEVKSISDISTLETMEEARVGKIDAVSDAASVRLWEVRDQFHQPIRATLSATTIRSSQASIKSLESDWNDVVHEARSSSYAPTATCYQVLHKVRCTNETGSSPKEETSYRYSIFLDKPSYSISNSDDDQWAILDGDHPKNEPKASHMCGRRPVPDLHAYTIQNQQLAFIVFKKYDCRHDAICDAKTQPSILPDSIYLCSQELCTELVKVYQEVLRPTQRSCFHAKSTLEAPYLWYYHTRAKIILSAQTGAGDNTATLLKYISTSMAIEYDSVDTLIARNMISWRYLPYIYIEGTIVTQWSGKSQESCEAYEIVSSCVARSKRRKDPVFELKLCSWIFDSTFKQVVSYQRIAKPSDDTDLHIASLPAVPLVYSGSEIEQYLIERGRMYWSCRSAVLRSYTGHAVASGALFHDKRFVIDTIMYGQIHDNKNIKPIVPGSLSWELSLADSAEDSFLMMLPATIHGYDVRNHEWQELFVSNLALVMPNAEVFDQVALSKNDKDLLHAMITSSMSKLHTRPNPGSRPDKDGRQILLLHGAPGSGKTFTAEAIAAMTARPLFRISGNDIGTASLKATQYLQGVSKLCNAWNCVVLFDNADIFFEQMRTQELERNAMVLSFLRSLESFKTLVVLTTNRVGVFDETVRSRIHLVVCVQKWDALTRKKVWKKMLSTHSDDNYTAEGDQLLDQVKDFTELPLNGWEISNMVKMAAQLARAHDQKLRRDHFVVVSKNSKDFSDLKINHMALELKKHERNHPHTARINSRGDQKIWPSGTPHNTSRSPTWPVKY